MASVGQVPNDDELAEMIRIADADGSGEVDFYEFVTLMAHKMADVRRPHTTPLSPAAPNLRLMPNMCTTPCAGQV